MIKFSASSMQRNVNYHNLVFVKLNIFDVFTEASKRSGFMISAISCVSVNLIDFFFA